MGSYHSCKNPRYGVESDLYILVFLLYNLVINIYISTKEILLHIECVDFKEVLQVIKDEFSKQIDTKGISWSEPENLPGLNVDRLAITRLKRNQIDNSLKYGGNELRKIGIGYDESQEFHILSVSDDGVGIKEEDSKKIFEVFKRDRSSVGIAGTGLGLAIVKEIAEQHQGEVRVETDKDKSLHFYIDISKHL